MNILITGGVGFIGTNAAVFFAKQKFNTITLVDDFSRKGVAWNAAYLSSHYPNISIIKSNVNSLPRYVKALARADLVIHLAGQTAVTTSITNPLLDFKSNIAGGFTVLEGVRKHNPNAVIIYSSTNKVYGDLSGHTLKLFKKESVYKDMCHPKGIGEDEQLNFISPYGCSKGAVDSYMLDYARIYGLRTVVFRQSCIYGPFQIGVEDQGWVAFFSKQALLRKPITIYGDGYQVRDLLYVEDLVRAYNKAYDRIDSVRGKAINIGGGVSNAHSVINVIRMLEKKTKYHIPLSFSAERSGDQKLFISANARASRLLKWKPETSFSKGLDALLTWQSRNLEKLK